MKGTYVVEYQVVSAGTYQMTITADGKPIDGSPFEVYSLRKVNYQSFIVSVFVCVVKIIYFI